MPKFNKGMDVTPTAKMFEAMRTFTDAACGEEPGKHETTAAAEQRANNRRQMMDWLHRFAHLCMREGAARAMNQSEIIHAPHRPFR